MHFGMTQLGNSYMGTIRLLRMYQAHRELHHIIIIIIIIIIIL